ncbi:lipoprotein-releasing ABC transporter permease subunit [Desulfurispira natronophila]|uniref:Lipoprotein-releasing system permease protein n=1 Tax=Desulfurispira natronophila TaxID=682562 RepID=A0A7W8DGT2_9BACT|nr:lipoprotein-releasing ABC transporter permease subunit [Desulfurispira natronophila]MBB5021588.1 lipoprotein-releasing system permease protein [Desulfurispira natronophila]
MYELTIAWRNLRGRKREKFISFIGLISVLGIAIGVAALIIVLGVMKGFETELRSKILGATSHIVISSYEGVMTEYKDLETRITALPGVQSSSGVLHTSLMLMGQRNVSGVVARGIDPKSHSHVAEYIIEGDLEDLHQTDSILVGKQLADKYHLTPGRVVTFMAPSGRIGPFGSVPKRTQMVVAGIFQTGMYEYDNSLAFASIETLTAVGGYRDLSVNTIEVRVDNIFDTASTMAAIRNEIGPGYSVRDWTELNANLFSALKLERVSMFLILCVIIIVASFNIISTLVMMVMEKTREIGILMSMGATRRSISRIFFLQGIILGIAGTILGTICGIILSLLLKRYQFVQLPPDVYMLDTVPVQLEPGIVASIMAISVLISILSTIYPARRAGKLRPVEALRND